LTKDDNIDICTLNCVTGDTQSRFLITDS
jgi:hypothetical protein